MGDYTIDTDATFQGKNPYDYKTDVNNLKEKCKIFLTPSITDAVNNDNKYGNLDNELSINFYNNQYKEQIDKGNRYIEDLLKIEEDFFKNKYGEKIYDYLKEKRKNYFNSNSSAPSGSPPSGSPPSDSDDWNTITEYYKKIGVISNYKNEMNVRNKISDNLNRIKYNTKLNERVIEYRNDLFEDIDYSNRYLIIFYYIIIILFFIYLMITEQLNFTPKTNTIYLILLIFPVIIYPLLWRLMVYLYRKINNNLKDKGPKNAFINNFYDT